MSIGIVDCCVGEALRTGREVEVVAGVIVTRSAWAQPPQNLSSGRLTVPQPGQPPGRPLPQPPQ
jgi:hypothetical protein